MIAGLDLVAEDVAEAERQATALAAVLDVAVTERGEDAGRRWEVGEIIRVWPARDGEPTSAGLTVQLLAPAGAQERARSAGLEPLHHGTQFRLSVGVDLLVYEAVTA